MKESHLENGKKNFREKNVYISGQQHARNTRKTGEEREKKREIVTSFSDIYLSWWM